MVGYIILAVVIALILLLLFMRFRLLIVLKNDRFRLYLKILFLKFELFGDKKSRIKKSDFKIRRFRRKRDKAIKKYRIKKEPKKSLKAQIKKKKSSPLILIKSLKDVIWDTAVLFNKRLKIKRFKIQVKVGGRDAAKVAINYGYVIQAVQYLVTFLESVTNLYKTKNKSADVIADFAEQKWSASLDAEMSINTIDAIILGISAFKGYIKQKLKKKPQKAEKISKDGADNGREQN